MNMVGNQGQVEEQGQPLPLKMILFKLLSNLRQIYVNFCLNLRQLQ